MIENEKTSKYRVRAALMQCDFDFDTWNIHFPDEAGVAQGEGCGVALILEGAALLAMDELAAADTMIRILGEVNYSDEEGFEGGTLRDAIPLTRIQALDLLRAAEANMTDIAFYLDAEHACAFDCSIRELLGEGFDGEDAELEF